VEASPEQRPGRTHRRLGQQPDQRRAGPLDRSAPRCRFVAVAGPGLVRLALPETAREVRKQQSPW